MHPILAERRQLWLYLFAWLPGAGLLTVLLALSGEVAWLHAALLSVPLSLIYAFICLASWYPCLAAPATRSNAPRLLTVHTVGALLSTSTWIFAGALWAQALDRIPVLHGLHADFRLQAPVFFIVGILLYALTVAVNYLLIAFEAERHAEGRNLELQFQAREAEVSAAREREAAEKERELARQIQRRLMPPAEIAGAGYLLGARHEPAQFVGGDFYDFFRTGDGQLGLVVADVAGKGIGASLIMASVQATLRLMASDASLLDTLAGLNRKLVQELAPREFVAVILGRFDPESGHLELANCGLPDPYLLREGQAPCILEVSGPRLPLGLRSQVGYETLAVRLQAGDRVLVVTDGLPEAPTRGGEPLGYEALIGMMDHEAAASPLAWLDRLLERVTAATEPTDDLTALLLQYRPLRSGADRETPGLGQAQGLRDRSVARDRRASGG